MEESKIIKLPKIKEESTSIILQLPVEIFMSILSYVPYQLKNWLNTILVCKFFYQIGKQLFDPSIRNQFPIRSMCSLGSL